jgi:rfaE bifunctional protein kinase chain/domain
MDPLSVLEKIAGLRILVVGDVMLDHYIWGDVHRISPEAPVPVISARRETWAAGGAANVALNLTALGVQTSILGFIGRDEPGEILKRLLRENGVSVLGGEADVVDGVSTIVKTRVLARTQQVCRIDRESKYADYAIDGIAALMQDLDSLVEKVDAIIISDYAKGVVNQAILNKLLGHPKRRFIAVDPKPVRKLQMGGVDLLTPNRNEALQLAGITEPPSGEGFPLEDICRRIHEVLQPKNLIVTLGAEGMAICESGTLKSIIPTQAQEVFDVSGAGDTVIAVLTAAMVAGADAHLSAQLANAAAGCVVAHVGTEPVRINEFRESIIGQHKTIAT